VAAHCYFYAFLQLRHSAHTDASDFIEKSVTN